MSWEATISGGKTVTLASWNTRLRALGAMLEHHPQFGMYHSDECLPCTLTIASDARFAGAQSLARSGPIAALLCFKIERFGRLDARIDTTSALADLDRRIARLRELGAPDLILEFEQERRASLERAISDAPDQQRVYLMAPEGHILVHTLACASYALACAGELHPLDSAGAFAGDAILGWMANRLTAAQAPPE